ncbi:MAG: LacI family DNA-binding transcriptional regulator [Deltaproteobacteria bacterium]|nr:LacI family DNA-binding transcriptional regulator [Deltaproteobacteria bacterium]
MAITIKDVARQAGVSTATVSRVMNEEEGVSQKTRESILKIAQSLNYYANFQARGLVAQKPEAIGIVIPQTSEHAFSNPYYAEILKGIGSKTNESGQYIVLSLLREENYARLFHHRLAAGIIVLANRINDPGIEEARKMKTPMVLIPGDPQKMDIPSVDGDNTDGVLQAVDHLSMLGHRSIAILYGPMNSKYSVERLAAFRKALRRNRLPLREDFFAEYDFTQQDAYVQMKKLLTLGFPPTAVLLMNDYGAMGVLRAVKEMGYSVPQDISILGFGDVPFASMTDPPLTTVHEPFQKMGYRAADMLLKMIQGKRLGAKHIVLPVELIIRKSTVPPPRRKRRNP